MASALAFGSMAALCWGFASVWSAPISRIAGPTGSFCWTTAAAVAVAVPAALISGPPAGTGRDWLLVAVAGLLYSLGTVLWFVAVRGGHVSVVVPIVATDGAIAAVLATLAGASLSITVGVALVWILVGIMLVTAGGDAGAEDCLTYSSNAPRPIRKTVAIALAVAACFGAVFFLSAEATSVPALWIVAGARSAQLICASAAFVLVRPRRPPRAVWKYVAAFAILDIAGYALFLFGAGSNAPVAAVTASQYAALAVVGGVLIYGERLRPRQAVGIVVLLAAVGSIAGFA